MNDYSVFNSINRISNSDWDRICDTIKDESIIAMGTIVYKDEHSTLVLINNIVGFEIIAKVDKYLNSREIADDVIVLIYKFDRNSRVIWGKAVPQSLLNIFKNSSLDVLCFRKIINCVTDLVNNSKSIQNVLMLLRNCDYSSEELKKAVPYEIKNILLNDVEEENYLRKAIVFILDNNEEICHLDKLVVIKKIQAENEKVLNKYIAIVDRIHWSNKINQYIGYLGRMATEHGFISVVINFPQTYFLNQEAGEIVDVTIDKIKGERIFCNIHKPDKALEKPQIIQGVTNEVPPICEISITKKDERRNRSPFTYYHGERIEIEKNGNGKVAFIKLESMLNSEHNQTLKYISIFRCLISPQVKLLYDLGIIESDEEKSLNKVQDILFDLYKWGLLTRGMFKVNNINPNTRIYTLSDRGKYYLTIYMKYFKKIPFSTSELMSSGSENVKRLLACNQAILAYKKYFTNFFVDFSIGNVYYVENISNAVVRPSTFISLQEEKNCESYSNKVFAFVEVLRNNPGYENIIIEKFPRYKKVIDNYQDIENCKRKLNLGRKPFLLIVGEDEQHNYKSYNKINEVLGEKSGITIVYTEDRLLFEKFSESHYVINNNGELNLINVDSIFTLTNE